jgi:hypothetical protein
MVKPMAYDIATLTKKISLCGLLVSASLIPVEAFTAAPADCRPGMSLPAQPGMFGDYAAVERSAGNEPACSFGN